MLSFGSILKGFKMQIKVKGIWFSVTGRMMKKASKSDLKYLHPQREHETWQYWVWQLALAGF